MRLKTLRILPASMAASPSFSCSPRFSAGWRTTSSARVFDQLEDMQKAAAKKKGVARGPAGLSAAALLGMPDRLRRRGPSSVQTAGLDGAHRHLRRVRARCSAGWRTTSSAPVSTSSRTCRRLPRRRRVLPLASVSRLPPSSACPSRLTPPPSSCRLLASTRASSSSARSCPCSAGWRTTSSARVFDQLEDMQKAAAKKKGVARGPAGLSAAALLGMPEQAPTPRTELGADCRPRRRASPSSARSRPVLGWVAYNILGPGLRPARGHAEGCREEEVDISQELRQVSDS